MQTGKLFTSTRSFKLRSSAIHNYTGAAYVVREISGKWNLQQKLWPSNGVAGDVFGYFGTLDASTALVGAYARDVDGRVDQGAAYFYSGPGLGPHT